MNLDCETILDVYTHKNRKFLCQIKVNPRSGKFKNCRCLSEEQWNAFDKELEKLITTIDNWYNEKCLKFIISPQLQVRVQKSNLSLKHFYKCCGTTGNCDISADELTDVIEANFVLDCHFDFQLDAPCSSQKYESDNETSLDDMARSPLSYVPYTPLQKKCKKNEIDSDKTPRNDFLECDENTYSPKPISQIVTNEPKCKPAKINACRISESSSSSHSYFHKEVLVKKDNIESPKNDTSLRKSSNRKSKKIKIQEHCVVNEIEQEKVDKTDNIRKREERSKSEDVFLEFFNENTKEHVSKKEQIRIKKKHNHFDIKVIKNRSKTLDEIPVELSVNREKIEPEIKMVEFNEKSYKKLDKKTKISSHKYNENTNKKCFAIKEIEPEKSLIQNEIKTALTNKSNKFGGGSKFKKNSILQGSNENIRHLNETPSSPTESIIYTCPQKIIRVEMKPKASNEKALKPLRRSQRSPSKPKRYVEEQHDLFYNQKSLNKCKELFSTDDDDDDYFENNNGGKINDNKIKESIFETPASKKSAHCTSSSSSSSKNKKRKRDKSRECEQEKHNMSKWLSKKKLMPLNIEVTKSSKATHTPSSSRPLPLKTSTKIKPQKGDGDSEKPSKPASSSLITLELPSKEELKLMRNKAKLMQKENAILRAELDKMRTSPPKEVDILSLQNIPVDEILDTFSTYRSELDQIYKNNRKKDYIKGHDGINHCFVIRLLKQNIQMKMLEKLTEAYSNSESTTQATLFANALLPEWVIRVYMEKFNFTRQQAIDQVKAQEEFQLHMEEQSENTFKFD